MKKSVRLLIPKFQPELRKITNFFIAAIALKHELWNNMVTMEKKTQQKCRDFQVTPPWKRCILKMDLSSHGIRICKADLTHESLWNSFSLLHFVFHNYLSFHCLNSHESGSSLKRLDASALNESSMLEIILKTLRIL